MNRLTSSLFLVWIYGCGNLVYAQREATVTPAACDNSRFRDCFTAAFQITLDAVKLDNTSQLCSTEAFSLAETCSTNYIETCFSDYGPVIPTVVAPYVRMLNSVFSAICKQEFPSSACSVPVDHCILDFALVLSHGNLGSICRQSEVTLECLEPATEYCSDLPRYLVAMVVDEIRLTSDLVCNHDSCSLEVAQQCLHDGMVAIETPVAIVTQSPVICSQVLRSVACITNQTITCDLGDIPESLAENYWFLYQFVDQQCREPIQDEMLAAIPSPLVSSVYLAAVATNPWSSTEDVCSLFNRTILSAVTHGNIMSMYTPNLLTWQQTMELNVALYSDVCFTHQMAGCDWPETPETPANDGAVCEVMKGEGCIDDVLLSKMILETRLGTQTWQSLCYSAHTMLLCAKQYTDGCGAGEDLSRVQVQVEFVVAFVGEECGMLGSPSRPAECDKDKHCDVTTAWGTCGAIAVQSTDVCLNSTAIYTCFHELTSDCNSIHAYPPQFYLAWLLRDCPRNESLLPDDNLLGISRCKMQFGYDLYSRLSTVSKFATAVCPAVAGHDVCLMGAAMPQMARFYVDKHADYFTYVRQEICSNLTFSDDVVPFIQEPDNCQFDTASVDIILYIQTLSNFPLMPITEKDEFCSLSFPDVVRAYIGPMVSDCSTTRQDVVQEAIYFYSDMFHGYCATNRPGQHGTCDVYKIHTCLEELGASLNKASGSEHICGPLHDAFNCVYDNSRHCDSVVQETFVQEVVTIHSMLGNITCPRMPWCDSAENETWIQEVCKVETVYDIDWLSCVALDNFDFCSNLTETVQCIENKLAGYDPVLYVTLKGHMTFYAMLVDSPCSYIPPDPPTIAPSHYTIRDCDQVLTSSTDVTKSGLCTAIGYYLQCLSAVDQSELTYVWRGILGSDAQTWLQTRLYMGCQLAGEEFPVDTGFDADNITSGNCEFDVGQHLGQICLQTLAQVTMTYMKIPLSKRQENYCYVMDELVACVHSEVGGCSNDQQRAMITNAQWFLDLRDSLGVCHSPIHDPRVCRPSDALHCMADLGLTLTQQLTGGMYKAACSKLLPVAICVDTQTSSCDYNSRRDVMQTFNQVSSIVKQTCVPAPPTSSSVCGSPGETTPCDLEEVLVCMVPVQTKLLQMETNWPDVCVAIPAMKTCIQRHTSNCDSATLTTVDHLMTSLTGRLDDQCPQIYCDECRARTCLAQLQQGLQFQTNVSLCVMLADTRQCIYDSAHHCEAVIGQTLLQEAELLVGEAGQHCSMALPTCLQALMTSAHEILNYNTMAQTTVHNNTGHSDLVFQRQCNEAESAYACMSYHVAGMEGQRRWLVNETLQQIASVVYKQCQEPMLQCYSCVNATSNEACNIQHTITCDPHTQVCGTFLTSDTITKGCVSRDICWDGCLGNHCSFCCHGDLCNQPWNYAITEPETCQPESALWCGFQLLSSLAQNHTMDCSFLQETIVCIQESTSDCTYGQSTALAGLARGLLTSDVVAACVDQSSVCTCGQCTSLILLTLMSGPYDDPAVLCGHLEKLYSQTLVEMSSPQCNPLDLQATYYNLNIATYVAQGICTVDHAHDSCNYNGATYEHGVTFLAIDGCNVCTCSDGHVTCTLMYCPPVEDVQCPTVDAIGVCLEECEDETDCTNNTLCCPTGCGHTCQQPVYVGPGGAHCHYDNTTYMTGDSFVAMDNCNFCFCSNGNVACTTLSCPPTQAGNDTWPDYSGCDVMGVQQCMERAALPYLSSLAYTGDTGHICQSAMQMLRCIHPKVENCPETVLLVIQSATWWNLGHIGRFCDVTSLVQYYYSDGNGTSPNATHPGLCSLHLASRCFEQSIGDDICSSYQGIMDCVTNFTSGCLSVDRVPVQFELQRHLHPVWQMCNFTLPHDRSDQLTDVAHCTMEFAQNVSYTITQGYAVGGPLMAVCDDVASYMSCLHLLDLSPLGVMYVGNMVESLSGVLEHCQQAPPLESIQCHVCNGSETMEDCDRYPPLTCGPQQVCHMTLQLDRNTGETMVTKGCAEPQWCEMFHGCNPDYMTCVDCCYGDRCNVVTMETTPTSMPTTSDPWHWTTTPDSNTRTWLPTTAYPETCHLEPVVNYMTVHILHLVTFTFLPLVDRPHVCSNFQEAMNTQLDELRSTCPEEVTHQIRGIADWLTDWNAAVCPQSHNASVNTEECVKSVSCVHGLGSFTTQNQTCRSLQNASRCLATYYPECPHNAQVVLNRTSKLLEHMEEAICVGGKPADPPHCVDVMATNVTARCDGHTALKCAVVLRKTLYNPFTTKDEFCGMMKTGMQCIHDNTHNCSHDVYSHVAPVVMEILQRTNGVCPDTWCPLHDNCHLETAGGCLAQLEYRLAEIQYTGHLDNTICLNITSTYHCILNSTEDCHPQDKYTIQRRFHQAVHHLYPVCHQAPVNISTCLETFEDDVRNVLHFDEIFTSKLVTSIGQYTVIRIAEMEAAELSNLIVWTLLHNAGFTNISDSFGLRGDAPTFMGIALPGVLSYQGFGGIALPGVLGDGIGLPGVLTSMINDEELIDVLRNITNTTDISELLASIAEAFGLLNDAHSGPDSETEHAGRRRRQATILNNGTQSRNGSDTGTGFWNDNSNNTATNGNRTGSNQTWPGDNRPGTNNTAGHNGSRPGTNNTAGHNGSRPGTNNTAGPSWNNTGNYIMSMLMQSLHHDKLLSLLNMTKTDLVHFLDDSVLSVYVHERLAVCSRIKEAYQCMYDNLGKQIMPTQQEFILQQTLQSLMTVAMERCKVPRCHSCNGLRDNEQCNRQPLQRCGPLEMCQTVVDHGLVTKGCTNRWTCEKECHHGNSSCFCCEGDLCNQASEPASCDVQSAVACAEHLLSHAFHHRHLNRSAVYHGASCMWDTTRGCRTKSHLSLHMAGHRILKLLQAEMCSDFTGLPYCDSGNCSGTSWTPYCNSANCSGTGGAPYCKSGNCSAHNASQPCERGNCSGTTGWQTCNNAGVVALVSMMQSEFRTPSTFCQLFNSTLQAFLSMDAAGRCHGDDLDAARWSMIMVHSQIPSMCPNISSRLYHNMTMNCWNSTTNHTIEHGNNSENGSVTTDTGNTTRNGTGNIRDGQNMPGNTSVPSGNGSNITNIPTNNCSRQAMWSANEDKVCEIAVAMETCLKHYFNISDKKQICSDGEWTKLTSCVSNLTTGCLSVQLVPIQNILASMQQDCTEVVNRTVGFNSIMDPFIPTAKCFHLLSNLPSLMATDADMPYSLCHMISDVIRCLATNNATLPTVSRMYLPGIVEGLESLQEVMCPEGLRGYNYTRRCPDTVKVECLDNPCGRPNVGVTHCPNLPTARCVSDYCYTCEPQFYFRGMNITDNCLGDTNVTECDVAGLSRKLSFYTTMMLTHDWYSESDMVALCGHLPILESLKMEVEHCSSHYRPSFEKMSHLVYVKMKATCYKMDATGVHHHRECDVATVTDMYEDLGHFLGIHGVPDDILCLKVRNAVAATEHILSDCGSDRSQTYIRESFRYMRSVIHGRCPDLTTQLYCNPRLPGLNINGTSPSMPTATPTRPGNQSTPTHTGNQPTATPTHPRSQSTPTHTWNQPTPTHTGNQPTPTHTWNQPTPTHTWNQPTPTHTGNQPTATPTHPWSQSTPTHTWNQPTATPTHPRSQSTPAHTWNQSTPTHTGNQPTATPTHPWSQSTGLPTARYTTSRGPTDRPTDHTCNASQAQWCIFSVNFPVRTQNSYCSKLNVTVKELKECVLPKTSGCSEVVMASVHDYYLEIFRESSSYCGQDFVSVLFHHEGYNGCLVPRCSFVEAQNCVGHLLAGDNGTCGNLDDVKECVAMATAGCSDLQRYPTITVLRSYAELLNLPQHCWVSMVTYARHSHMTGVMQCIDGFTRDIAYALTWSYHDAAGTCTSITSLLSCLDRELHTAWVPPIVGVSLNHMVAVAKDAVNTACNNPVTGRLTQPGDTHVYESESCDVRTALFCLNSYAVHVILGPSMTEDGKDWLCSSLNQKAECIESAISNCSTTRLQQFRVVYRLVQMLGQLSGVCSPAPFICAPHEAVQCVATLGQAVASYGTYSHQGDVCRAIEYTRSCIKQTTLHCSTDIQQSILDTLGPISCQAYSICPMAIEDADVTTETPPSCVDPGALEDYGICEPQKALYCLQELYVVLNDPFGNHNKTCRAYSDALQCYFRHIQNCDGDFPVLLSHVYLHRMVDDAAVHHCPTRIAVPCHTGVSGGCDLDRIEWCMSGLRDAMDDGMGPHWCFIKKEAIQCMDHHTQSFPNATRLYAQSLYLKIATSETFTDVDCSGVDQCAYNYVSYMNSLIRDEIYLNNGSHREMDSVARQKGVMFCEARIPEMNCVRSQIDRVPADVGLVLSRTLNHLEALFTDACAYVYGLNRTCADCDGRCLACYVNQFNLHSILPPLLSFMAEAAETDVVFNRTFPFCQEYDVFYQQLPAFNGSSTCDGEVSDWLTSYQRDLDTLHRKYCAAPCNVTTAETCIDDFTAAIANASGEEICLLYEGVQACANTSLTRCDQDTVNQHMSIASNVFNSTGVKCYISPDIKVSTATEVMTLTEGGAPAYVNITMATSPMDSCHGNHCDLVVYVVIEDGDSMSRCSDGKAISRIVTDSCMEIFSPDDWQNPRSIAFWARMDHRVTSSHHATVTVFSRLDETGSSGAVRELARLQVSVVDRDSSGTCSAVGDPHLTTFDGLTYDTHMQGEFVLYEHQGQPYKVNVAYQRCRPGSVASCTCAVMVQSGDDVFVVDRCRRRGERSHPLEFKVHQNGDLTADTAVYTDQDGRVFQFVLPTGTIVTVQSGDSMLDVRVKPSAREWNNTLGLCGTYDGDINNDLTTSKLTVVAIADVPTWGNFRAGRGILLPNRFVNSWRSQESLFVGVSASAYTPPIDNIKCTCGPGSVCNSVDVIETCDFVSGQDITSELNIYRQVAPQSRNRRKRQTSTGDDIDWDIYFEPELPTWPTPGGWTEVAASDLCEDSIVNTPLGQLCATVVDIDTAVDNCMADILLFDSTDHIDGLVEDMRLRCGTVVLSDPAVAVTLNMTYAELVSYMLAQSCLHDCSGHGSCVSGMCQCATGYTTSDCSMLLSDAPVVISLSTSLYSATGQGAITTEIDVFGSDFVDNDKLSCHYQQTQFNSSTRSFEKTGKVLASAAAIFLTFQNVRCTLTGSLPLSAYYISVSNNGENQSAELGYIFLDPVCYSCNPATMECDLELTSCVVEAGCYAAGAPNPTDHCYICDPITNTFQYKTSGTCDGPTTPLPLTTTMTTGTASASPSITVTATNTVAGTSTPSTTKSSTTATSESSTTSSTTTTSSSTTEVDSTKTTTTIPATTTPLDVGTGSQEGGEGDDDDTITIIVLVVGVGVGILVLIIAAIVAIKLRRNDSRKQQLQQQQQNESNHGDVSLVRGHNIQGRPNPAFVIMDYDNVQVDVNGHEIPRRDAPAIIAPFNPEGLAGESAFSGAIGSRVAGSGIRGDDDELYQVNMTMFTPPGQSAGSGRVDPSPDYAVVGQAYPGRRGTVGVAETYDNGALSSGQSRAATGDEYNSKL